MYFILSSNLLYLFHIKISLFFAFLSNLEAPQEGVVTEEPVHQENNAQNQGGNN